MQIKKLISFIVLLAFLFTSMGQSYVWALNKAGGSHALRAPSGMKTSDIDRSSKDGTTGQNSGNLVVASVPNPAVPLAKPIAAIPEIVTQPQTFPLSDKNSSSGDQPEIYHDKLDAQIKELIGTENDLTGNYDQSELKKELIKMIPNIFSLVAKEQNSGITGFFKYIEIMLKDSNTCLYFLKPKIKFMRFGVVLPNGQPLIAASHFSFNKADREHNIYLAAPFYNTLSHGDQLGLIMRAGVHLVLGGDSANKVDELADLAQFYTAYAYDHPNITPELAENLKQYMRLKLEIIDEAQNYHWSGYQQKRREILSKLDEVYSQVKDFSPRTMGRLFHDIFNGADLPEYLFANPMEIQQMRTPDFTAEERELDRKNVAEIVEQAFDTERERSDWQKAIPAQIEPWRLEIFLPEDFSREYDDEDKAAKVIQSISIDLPRMAHAGGFFNVPTKSVYFSKIHDPIERASILQHELAGHYLPFHNLIQISHEYEFLGDGMKVLKIVDEVGEENLALYGPQVSPVIVDLFNAGREVFNKGYTTFLVNPVISCLDGSYINIRFLEERVRQVYRDRGLPLAPLASEDRINRQMGALFAGIMYENRRQNGIPPLKTMRKFFAALYSRYRPPTKDEKIWRDQDLLPRLINYAKVVLRVDDMEFSPITSADGLGFWQYEPIKNLTKIGNLTYVPGDCLPRDYDGVSEAKRKKIAEERAFGQLSLAAFRHKHGRWKVLKERLKVSPEEEPLMEILWQVLETPRVISAGLSEGRKGAVDWIGRVLRERYWQGDNELANAQLSSLKPHLQMLDVILNCYVNGSDNRQINQDVVGAVNKTRNVWQPMILNSLSDEQMIEGVEKIWGEYLKLYQKAKEDEIGRNVYERMQKEEEFPGSWEALAPEVKDAVSEALNQLPEETKEAIIQASTEALKRAAQMYKAGLSSSGGEQINENEPEDEGSLSVTPKLPTPDKQGQLPDFNRQLKGLQEMLDKMAGEINDIQQKSKGISRQAGNVSEKGQGIDEKAGSGEDLEKAVEEISREINELVKQAHNLREKGVNFQNQAQDTEGGALNEVSQTKHPDKGEELIHDTQELGKESRGMQDKIGQLIRQLSALKSAVEGLQSSVADKKGAGNISAHADQVSGLAEKAKNIADDVSCSTQQIKNLLGKIERIVGTANSNKEDGLEPAKKTGNEGGKRIFKGLPPDKTSPSEGRQGDDQPNVQVTDGQSGNNTATEKPVIHAAGKPLSGLGQQIKSAKNMPLAERGKPSAQDDEPNTDRKELLKRAQQIVEQTSASKTIAELAVGKLADKKEADNLINQLGNQITAFREDFSKILKAGEMGGEEHGLPFGQRLTDFVGALTDGKAFSIPTGGKFSGMRVSIVVDTTHSMGYDQGKRILAARMTLALALASLLPIIVELKEGDQPLELEVAHYNDYLDEGIEFLLTYEESKAIKENEISAIIAKILEKIKPVQGANGNDLTALQVMQLRGMRNKPDDLPVLGIFISDGNYAKFMADMQKTITEMKNNNFPVLAAAVGDNTNHVNMQKMFGEENTIVLDFDRLGLLGEGIMGKVKELINPESGVYRQNFLSSVIPLIPCGGLFSVLLKYSLVTAHRLFFSTVRQEEIVEEPYPNFDDRFKFYIRYEGNKKYLVHKNSADKDDVVVEMGPGGKDIPQDSFPYTPTNEKYLVEILNILYPKQLHQHASVSYDQRVFLKGGNGKVEIWDALEEKILIYLARKDKFWDEPDTTGGIHSADKQFELTGKRALFMTSEDKKYFIGELSEKNGLPNSLSIDSRGWVYVFYSGNNCKEQVIIYQPGQNSYEEKYDLSCEEEIKEIRLLNLEGPSGVAKTKMVRVLAGLINRRLATTSVHEGMTKADFEGYTGTVRSAGGVSSSRQLSPAVRKAKFGGLSLWDEFNKSGPGVRIDALDAFYHRVLPGSSADSVHPDFRGILTGNIGLFATYPFTNEEKDKIKTLTVTYQPPEDELEILNFNAGADSLPDKEREELKNVFFRLIGIADYLRLMHEGYNSANITKIFADWSLFTDELKRIVPDYRLGEKMRRPPSPRVLINIAKDFATFPGYRKYRPWSIISRFYNFATEEDQVNHWNIAEKLFRDSFDNIKDIEGNEVVPLITPEDVTFPVSGIAGKTYKYLKIEPKATTFINTKGEEETVDWDAVEIKLHPDALDYLDSETRKLFAYPSIALKTYEILQDLMALHEGDYGRHMMIVGPGDSLKDRMVRRICRLLGGPQLLTLNFQKETRQDDVVAARAMENSETYWQPGTVLKAFGDIGKVRQDPAFRGKPVACFGTNHAPSRILAISNNIKQNQEITLPDGTLYKAAPGFVTFDVITGKSKFSPEYIERHVTHEIGYPLPREEADMLYKESGEQLNPYFIGSYDQKSGSWQGLMAVVQKLRQKAEKEPRLLSRPPGVTIVEDFVIKIVSKISDLPPQELGNVDNIVLKEFLLCYNISAPEKEVVKQIFQEEGFWTAAGGAIKKYMNGNPIIVELGVIREPKLEDSQIKEILTTLQTSVKSPAIPELLNILEEKINTLTQEYPKNDISRRLVIVHDLLETYRLLNLVAEKRNHNPENKEKIEAVYNLIADYLEKGGWPSEVLETTEIKAPVMPDVGNSDYDELLVLLQLFPNQNEYLQQVLDKLSKEIINISDSFAGDSEQLYESTDKAGMLWQIKTALEKIAQAQDNGDLNELIRTIQTGLNENGWGFLTNNPDKFAENISWQKYLKILQKAVIQRDKMAQAEAKKLFEQAREEEVTKQGLPLDKDIEPIFDLFWGIMTIRATKLVQTRLEKLDKILTDLIRPEVWDDRYYDESYFLYRKLLWITDGLDKADKSFSSEQLNKACENIFRSCYGKISNQLRGSYHWPKNWPGPKDKEYKVDKITIVKEYVQPIARKILSEEEKQILAILKGKLKAKYFNCYVLAWLSLLNLEKDYRIDGLLVDKIAYYLESLIRFDHLSEDDYDMLILSNFFGRLFAKLNEKQINNLLTLMKDKKKLILAHPVFWERLNETEKKETIKFLENENELGDSENVFARAQLLSNIWEDLKVDGSEQAFLTTLKKMLHTSDHGRQASIILASLPLTADDLEEKDTKAIVATMVSNRDGDGSREYMTYSAPNWLVKLAGEDRSLRLSVVFYQIRGELLNSNDKIVRSFLFSLALAKLIEKGLLPLEEIYLTFHDEGKTYKEKIVEIVASLRERLKQNTVDERLRGINTPEVVHLIIGQGEKDDLVRFTAAIALSNLYGVLDKLTAEEPIKKPDVIAQQTVGEKISEKTIVENISLNYGKLWSAYCETVIDKQDQKIIDNVYGRLIAGIKEANSLEIVPALQDFYLHLISRTAILEVSPAEVQKITQTVRERLVTLQNNILAGIDLALKTKLSGDETELLTDLRKVIDTPAYFTQPLKILTETEKPELFKYSAKVKKADKILSKFLPLFEQKIDVHKIIKKTTEVLTTGETLLKARDVLESLGTVKNADGVAYPIEVKIHYSEDNKSELKSWWYNNDPKKYTLTVGENISGIKLLEFALAETIGKRNDEGRWATCGSAFSDDQKAIIQKGIEDLKRKLEQDKSDDASTSVLSVIALLGSFGVFSWLVNSPDKIGYVVNALTAMAEAFTAIEPAVGAVVGLSLPLVMWPRSLSFNWSHKIVGKEQINLHWEELLQSV